jgi:hypothetical protein
VRASATLAPMSKQTNKLIALALVGACGFGVYQAGLALLGDEEQSTKYAVNQVWIDHFPRDERDMVMHMVLLDHRDGKFGGIGQSSQWRHRVDIFRWQLDGGTLGMFFPQDRAKGKVKVSTWECKDEAPEPFELCMKLTADNGRSVTLYSRKDWKIEPHDSADSIAEIVDDTPELAGLLQELDEDAAERVGALDLDVAQTWPLHDPL